jgi:hypothetical protein
MLFEFESGLGRWRFKRVIRWGRWRSEVYRTSGALRYLMVQ